VPTKLNPKFSAWTSDIEIQAIRRSLVGIIRPIGDFGSDAAIDILMAKRRQKLCEQNVDPQAVDALIYVYHNAKTCEEALEVRCTPEIGELSA
jgi:hypothetical protein